MPVSVSSTRVETMGAVVERMEVELAPWRGPRCAPAILACRGDLIAVQDGRPPRRAAPRAAKQWRCRLASDFEVPDFDQAVSPPTETTCASRPGTKATPTRPVDPCPLRGWRTRPAGMSHTTIACRHRGPRLRNRLVGASPQAGGSVPGSRLPSRHRGFRV